MIGAILTQNTAWTNVEKAINNLKKAGLISSPAHIMRADSEKLASYIRPAGYYNIKAKRLKNFASFIIKNYGGNLTGLLRKRSLAALREEFLTVNGVGPETCDSILLYALDKPIFVVDAYTKRIFSRHGFFKEDESYSTVQDYFMSNLPSDVRLFNEFHALIVRLAKDHCRTSPKCKDCPLERL